MNRATKLTAGAWGVILGISGILHGFFETLQGNIPTDGQFINAISKTHQIWEHGTEPAFTIIPNFLATGIAAIIVGLVLIIWSISYLHTKHGATVFLLLFVLLVLVGGGVAQVLLFPVVLAGASQIHKPLNWWRKILPEHVLGVLTRVWPWSLGMSSLLLLLSLAIAIFGFFPGVNDADQVLLIMVISLFSGFGLFILSIIAGFAHDIQRTLACFETN